MLANPTHSPVFVGHRPAESGKAIAQSASDQACLSVEFFGAAGAGKTTVARALAENLRLRRRPVRLIQSGRASAPGVRPQPRRGLPLPAQLTKLAGGLQALFRDGQLSAGQRDPVLQQIQTILPTGSRVRDIRIRRYAADLCRAWRESQRAGEGLILDQGFITLLCSISLQSDPIDRSALAGGLALVPRADLLIHVDAPRTALESRLQERVRRRGGFERLFGVKIGTWLRQAEIASILAEMIAESGRPPVRVRSLDRADVDAAVQTIVEKFDSLTGDMPECSGSH